MAAGGNRQDEGDWLRRLREGEEAVFAEFVQRHQASVFLCCRSLGLNQVEAEDAASETFLAAYKGLRRFDGRSKLSTWLWRIAYRQAVNYLRKNKRAGELVLEGERRVADENWPSAVERVEEKEHTEIVWEAVAGLPKLWSIATLLFYREGKSIAEIAKIMGVRKNTVKTYLYRSRDKLRNKLGRILGEESDEGKQTRRR